MSTTTTLRRKREAFDKKYMTPLDISVATGRHIKTIRRWCRNKQFPVKNVAAPGAKVPQYRARAMDVEKFMAKQWAQNLMGPVPKPKKATSVTKRKKGKATR